MSKLQIDPEKAEEKIDEFIKQAEGLLELSYEKGKQEKKEMETRLDNFAKTAFSDGEEKKDNLYPDVVTGAIGLNSKQRQNRYEDQINRKLRNLKAWKEQVELEKSSTEEKAKIEKMKEEVEEEKLESERRENVAEQKYHGAVIELLDLQRDRIKENEKTSKEITEMKKEIQDIKELLEKVLEEKEGENDE
ncbi:hypothetical protein [Candidatus Nanohalovita haloferacivicina]|uniref:hypothetical protein n=1 Tax=Candidatus Nanohalovita haloferacivicina TaxID=2978046 RepID=UPI00325FA02B|nr:hypothetical protein HBNXNv_0481 [Candidatus Nanohalobia archaeon BNXNv]